MTSFFQLPSVVRMLLQILLYLAIVFEVVTLMLYFFRRSEKHIALRVLFEVGIVFFYLVTNLVIGLIQINSPNNLMVDPYPYLRSLCLLVPFLGMPIFMVEHRNTDLLAIFCLILSLPFMESIFLQQSALFQAFILVVLFSRSFLQLLLIYLNTRSDISRFSMKEAFDTFPEGLAIGREHGNLLLTNLRMRRIMSEKGLSSRPRSSNLRITFRRMMKREELEAKSGSREFKSINVLAQNLLSEKGKGSPEDRRAARDNTLRTFALNDKVYRYTDEPFSIRGRKYRQILVNDITVENALLLQIKEKNEELEENNRQLETLVMNIEEIEREKESSRMRNRIHDIMGQRLSILHGTLQQMDRNDKIPPLDELMELLEDMVKDLHEKDQTDAEQRFIHIRNTAEIVGTRLLKRGEIPNEAKVSEVILQVLREAVTNAIRHGQADTIEAIFRDTEKTWTVLIQNNGRLPLSQPREGEGIRGMRKKVEDIGGSLRINSEENFSLLVEIPKQGADKDSD